MIAFLVHRVRSRMRRGFAHGHAGLGRDDQRPGRHHPRHPRRQGLCPGAPRERALSRGQRSRVSGQLPRQRPVVVFRADRQPADRAGTGRRVGLRLVARLPNAPEQPHRRRPDRVRAIHRAVLRPHGLDEPHGGRRAAGRGQRAADFRHPRSRAQRRRAGQTGPCRAAAGQDRVPTASASITAPGPCSRT